MVETESDEILRDAEKEDVALLVVGDPLGATTHTDIILRARSLGINTQLVHNASVMNAAGACGLQLYNFGQTVSIPFWTDNWKPDSWLARIQENIGLGLHTLLLLDIKVKEQSEENLARGRKIYEPPRYMTPTMALHQVLAAMDARESSSMKGSTTLALTLSRLGSPSQKIVAGTLKELYELPEVTFGDPLHAMVIVGHRLHPLEVEFTKVWAVGDQWESVARDSYHVKE